MRTSAQAFVLKGRFKAFHKLFEEYENTYAVSHTAKSFFQFSTIFVDLYQGLIFGECESEFDDWDQLMCL